MNAASRLRTLATLMAATLILAAIVHLVVILLVPRFAERDAYTRLARASERDATTLQPRAAPTEREFPYADPAVAMAICRFDLANGPVRITAPAGRGFTSLSFHTAHGQSFYALTDKAAAQDTIEAVLATPEDIRELEAQDDEEDPSHDLRVQAPERQGFVALRVFSEEPSLYPAAEELAKQLVCKTEPLPR